ncbi:hypothetical protein CMQ_216 [Grosmannia clavigera kw1407]|uniref:Uncharacterized protein n=1 Tax=Grosmannia clavigera (strain kw1407 / UAMH 11150) TaxID=655863 RepID=F0XR28_GROCL|nr:uncharacterized protein CMQ_216 [Grosmannia clavigera kw1407]EFW99898.1 hypothetical protein CMQ_216 [Grosmannia clavigera kw1407]
MATDESDYALGWGQDGQDLLLMKTVATALTGFCKTTNIRATPACLIPAGSSTPIKFCSSGWRPQNEPYNILDNGKWTELNASLPAATGDGFVIDNSQLGLFFLTQQIRHAKIPLNDALQGRLLQENLPLCRRRAKIVLGHKPCKNCLDFLKLICRRTGIDVRTESCAVFDRHVKLCGFYEIQPKQQDSGPQAKELDSSKNIDSSDNESQDDEQTAQKHTQNGWESCTRESSLEEEPVFFSSQRRGRPAVSIHSDSGEEDSESVKELSPGNVNDEPELPLPALQYRLGRMSVFSTPSPSLPESSFPGSSPVPRRLRFTPVSASPPRFGGTGAPPAHWGPCGKPPPTPCFVAPASAEKNSTISETVVEPSLSNSSVMPSMAPQVSYFFASASPEPAAGQAEPPSSSGTEAQMGTAQQPVELLEVPETPLLAERRPPPSFQSRLRENMPPPQYPARPTQRLMQPPPRPVTPVRNESADVEFVLSMSIGSSPDTSGRAGTASRPYADQTQWQSTRAPSGSAAQRPLGVTPVREPSVRLDHPGAYTGARVGIRREALQRARLRTNLSASTPAIDLTAQPSSSSAVFVRRPHPMPAVTFNMGRRLSERVASPPQQRNQQWHRRMLGGKSRTAATSRPQRQLPSFPDLQAYRFEV